MTNLIAGGQKFRDLVSEVQITTWAGEAKLPYSKRDSWHEDSNDWRVTLHYQGRRMSVDFWQGKGIKTNPTAESVLECLISDALCSGDGFSDFCSNMGYDSDSRKVHNIYRTCVRTRERLIKLFGGDYQLFVDAERD